MTELIVCPVRYRVFPAAILIVVSSFAPTSTAFTYCVESTFRFSPLEENLRKSSCDELDVAGTVESAHVAELLQFPLVLTIDSPKSADDAIEEKINSAENDFNLRERELYNSIVAAAVKHSRDLFSIGNMFAELDVYQSFAEVASLYNYIRPLLTDGGQLEIADGRHGQVCSRHMKGLLKESQHGNWGGRNGKDGHQT